MENINEIERKLEEQKKIIYEYCSGQISLAHILKGEGNKEEANEVIEEVIRLLRKNHLEERFSNDDLQFLGYSEEEIAYINKAREFTSKRAEATKSPKKITISPEDALKNALARGTTPREVTTVTTIESKDPNDKDNDGETRI